MPMLERWQTNLLGIAGDNRICTFYFDVDVYKSAFLCAASSPPTPSVWTKIRPACHTL